MKNHRSFWCFYRKDDKVRKNIWNKIKQNKAFSLMETLLVVAIMGILVGVSIPMITKIQSSSNNVELDNYAKTIFMEAQNQLVAMRGEGSLKNLEGQGSQLTDAPSGFEGTYNGELYCINKDQAADFGIIPAGTNTHQLLGEYAVEYNPKTGEVYAVFYWTDTAVSYNKAAFDNYRSNKDDRAKAKVGYYGGGSASTEVIAPSEPLVQELELVNGEELFLLITFDKKKELIDLDNKLNIACTIKDQSGDTVTCKIVGGQYYARIYEDEIAVGTQIPAYHKITPSGRLEYALLLDSMQSGHGFGDLFENKLTPGDQLTIEVKSTYITDDYYYSDEDTIKGNSLFADKAAGADGSTTIKVNTLRHLRNLGGAYYTNTDNKVNITLTGDIDFKNTNFAWNGDSYKGAGKGFRPTSVDTSFTSISNDSLFGITDSAGVKRTIDGQGKRLQNFVISGSGIFAITDNTYFSNINIEDITVSGGADAGALVGSASDGEITKCGVYLTTYPQGFNIKDYYAGKTEGVTAPYKNQMEQRYATMSIRGNNNVGGLVGSAKNLDITSSFAAVQVQSGTTRGGLVGNMEGGSINRCYVSGDITGGANVAGGLIGEAKGTSVESTYATGDLEVSTTIGGLVGKTSGSNYKNSVAYGEVPKGDGFTSGGFAGSCGTGTDADTFGEGTTYLKQSSYNAGHVDSPVAPSGYASLAAKGNLALGASYPYDSAFYENKELKAGFPFEAVTGSHYGNWPTEQFMDVPLLVYYEFYEDGTYGLYGETKIPVTQSVMAAADSTVWIVDSLQEKACIEDGYALLTRYELTKFSYKLNDAATSVELTVVDEFSGDDNAKEGMTVKVEAPDGTNFNGVPTGDLYFYKLPYSLQLPDNNDTRGFYDKLTVFNGKAKGNDSTPVIGGADSTNAVNFYYVPYFAKTAVNPSSLTDDGKIETVAPANPATVAIRSARQLNALGRYNYFWDARTANGQKVTFLQESDINFRTYGDLTKNKDNPFYIYCGKTHNMCGVNPNVPNVPIGDTDKYFSNKYNGQGYYIEDYGFDNSTKQYAGLFGAIDGASIENIVMLAHPVNGTTFGKITSSYNASKKAGSIGSLVGFARGKNNTIKNCTAAGYNVEYGVNSGNALVGVAIGGLIGNTYSTISNCSAVNNIVLHVGADKTMTYSDLVYMGGLVGSIATANLQNGYAGGTMDVVLNNGSSLARDKVFVAGVCPGWLYVIDATQGSTGDNSTVEYSALYSYMDIKQPLRTTIKGDSKLYPVVGYHKEIPFTASDGLEALFDPKFWLWLGALGNNASANYSNCYYLETVYKYPSGDVTLSRPSNAVTPLTYEGLQHLYQPMEEDGNRVEGFTNTVKSDPNIADTPLAYTHPISDNMTGMVYTFPTVIKGSVRQDNGEFVKDASGKVRTDFNVHYGDWYTIQEKINANFPTYYEVYEDSSKKVSYGLYYIGSDGKAVSTLEKGNETNVLTITKTGYGVLNLEEQNGEKISDVEINERIYHLYKKNLDVDAQNTDSNPLTLELDFDYKFSIVEVGGVVTPNAITTPVKLYINQNYAAAISADSKFGIAEDMPFQIRTAEQFKNIEKAPEVVTDDGDDTNDNTYVYMKQTYDIDLSKGHTPINIKKNYTYDGGAQVTAATPETDFRLKNAENTIFGENNGTIKNCYVENLSVVRGADSEPVAGFVLANNKNAKIIGCGIYGSKLKSDGTAKTAEERYASVTITGNEAYGFVVENNGEIEKSSVTGVVKGLYRARKVEQGDQPIQEAKAGMAAGFAKINKGYIELSYANCNVTVNGNDGGKQGHAAGFVINSAASGIAISKCYSAGSVDAATTDDKQVNVYGFAGSLTRISGCYTISEIGRTIANQNEISEYAFAYTWTPPESEIPSYWAYDTDAEYNTDIKSTSIATRISLSELKNKEQEETKELNYPGFTGEDVPYTSSWAPDYPYPSVGIPHYGDWAKATINQPVLNVNNSISSTPTNFKDLYVGVYYYEQYGEGRVGIYAEGCTGQNNSKKVLFNTLAVAGETVFESGYGVFCCDNYESVLNGNKEWRVKVGEPNEWKELSAYVSGKKYISLSEVYSGYKFYIMKDAKNVAEYSESMNYSSNINGNKTTTFTIVKANISRPSTN